MSLDLVGGEARVIEPGLVSVVIPFFNAERTLMPAVQSVLAQTYENWELILLDDGSNDGSLALARQVDDVRVQVVSDGRNLGLIDRLNQMIPLTHGEFIARMDADDLMARHRLQRQVQVLRQFQHVDVVATAIASMTHDFRVTGVREMQPLDMSPASVLTCGGIVHPSIMARRVWFASHAYRRGYERAEDRELFLRALPDTGFSKLCEPLYFYMEAGVQSCDKLLRSYHTERKIIREYGSRYLGARAWMLWLRSALKSLAVVVLSLTGSLDWLARRRIRARDPVLEQTLQGEVDAILSMPLPRRSVV